MNAYRMADNDPSFKFANTDVCTWSLSPFLCVQAPRVIVCVSLCLHRSVCILLLESVYNNINIM